MLDCFSFIHFAPKAEACEDAFCYDFSEANSHLIGVFDGCGGLGAKRYSKVKNKTGAFVAAQTAARVSSQLFSDKRLGIDSELFHDNILNELIKFEKEYGEKSNLVGSMIKTLPTTAAFMTIDSIKTNSKRIISFSVGDSRNYLLTAQYGLQQISVDDLQGNPDALENIRDSAPLSNVINIDTPFVVKTRSLVLKEPFAIISATDGVFSYLRSPMDFEAVILEGICQNDSIDAFKEYLYNIFSSTSGDDSTMIAAFYGWGSYKNLQDQLSSRHKYANELVKRMNSFNFYQDIVDIWNEYKANYFVKADALYE